MLNEVLLIGTVDGKPTQTDKMVSFRLKTERPYTSGGGEKRTDTCFVRVIAFGYVKDQADAKVFDGEVVFVKGCLQGVKDQAGHWGHQIKASEIQALEEAEHQLPFNSETTFAE